MSAEPDNVATEIVGRNNPWIGEFLAEDGDLIYYIFIELEVLCSVNSFSLYYVFNLAYERNSKDLSVLFQEHIFGLPENALKKSSTYLSLTTNIQNFVMH